MASFQSNSPLTLLLIILFVIVISIHHSNGDEDEPAEPLRGQELAKLICNSTSYNKFCVDTLTPVSPDARASDIADSALRLAQVAANDARTIIANLLTDRSSPIQQQERRILQGCQLDNNLATTNLTAASNDLNSDTINSMIDDLNSAANVTKSCQDIIKKTRFLAMLSDKNMDVIRLCDICVVCTQFFDPDDL
ncbi:Pectinesterase inhibitor [Corchorus capsularis]|uniref:Pectinesterase inhibitor n=1 Tax=Corchorus capsularis TaxID=210143 RepID=A0A1R3H831_COCAP|nr:Pectinesterase inhibitor [Corchorus capsularis]